jgi:molybdopterin converting factor small subunit
MVTVTLPGPLHAAARGCARVRLEPAPPTVGAALEALFRLHPALRDRIVTEQGDVRPHVNVFVDRASIRRSGGLATPLRDGAAVAIIPAVSGG